ncbi:unnamed protein product, partial [Staurois parvus]
MYGKWVETAMFYYVKFVLKKMKFFKIFKFPAPDVTGTGTQKPDAGIGQRRWPGKLQGAHRG